MDTNTLMMAIWLPIVVAAIIQASFSLSLSVLTLLSGASLANRQPRRGHGALVASYVLGSMVVTAALFVLLAWLFRAIDYWSGDNVTLLVLISALMTAGFAVLLFYYRYDPKGTRLWLPRRFAKRLYAVTKQTHSNRGSFLLGGTAVLLELVFIIFPLMIAAYLAMGLDGSAYYSAMIVYTLLATSPLIILALLYARGRKIATIQRWRERNKRFLQLSAGIVMITLSIFLLVYEL